MVTDQYPYLNTRLRNRLPDNSIFIHVKSFGGGYNEYVVYTEKERKERVYG